MVLFGNGRADATELFVLIRTPVQNLEVTRPLRLQTLERSLLHQNQQQRTTNSFHQCSVPVLSPNLWFNPVCVYTVLYLWTDQFVIWF